jgi:hypothetical protein
MLGKYVRATTLPPSPPSDRWHFPVLSLEHLDAIRVAEIDKIAAFFPAGARIREIGAGTGKQAQAAMSIAVSGSTVRQQ